MEKYTYLLVNLGAVAVPLAFSFHPRLQFWKNIRPFLLANVITAVAFIAWDMYFTALGVWGFNERYVNGIFLYGLPLEELFFFFCIPYACLFSYHCFGIWKGNYFKTISTKWISATLCCLLLLAALLFADRIYTCVTFILLAVFLAYAEFIYRASWLMQFYFTYLIMLIPFFVVNGILTGTGLEEPVVWYNSAAITGLRLLTIPFEDIFYGMLLIGVNTFFYQALTNPLPAPTGMMRTQT